MAKYIACKHRSDDRFFKNVAYIDHMGTDTKATWMTTKWFNCNPKRCESINPNYGFDKAYDAVCCKQQKFYSSVNLPSNLTQKYVSNGCNKRVSNPNYPRFDDDVVNAFKNPSSLPPIQQPTTPAQQNDPQTDKCLNITKNDCMNSSMFMDCAQKCQNLI